MKAYNLDTRFNFGKYDGKTLEDVFKTDPQFIEKSLISVDDFVIDEKAIQKLFETYPDKELSDEAIDANLDKLDAMDLDDDNIIFPEEIYDGFENEDELDEDGAVVLGEDEENGLFDDDEFEDGWKDESGDDADDDFR